jgi:hypothetical protein
MRRGAFVAAGVSLIAAGSTILSPANPPHAVAAPNGTLARAWVAQQPEQVGDYATDFQGVEGVAADDAWAVGVDLFRDGSSSLLAEHYDGTSWTSVPPAPVDGILFDVAAVGSADVWAVGAYRPVGRWQRTLVEHWDGASWQVVPSPNPGPRTATNELRAVFALGPNDVWASGTTYTSDPPATPLVEHWNGRRWKVIPTPVDPGWKPNTSRGLTGLSGTSAEDVWAAGWTQGSSQSSTVQPLVEHWNGIAWSILPASIDGFLGSSFSSIAAVGPDDVWAVGGASVRPSRSKALIEHWDGTTWSVSQLGVPVGRRSGLIDVMATPDGPWSVGWAAGRYGGGPISVHLDGGTWSIVRMRDIGGSMNGAGADTSGDLWAVGTQLIGSTVYPVIAFHAAGS